MMKRFELSRFSPLEVSRRVQQCLRFEGVNTNGVASSPDSIGVAAETEPISSESMLNGDGSGKTNLLTTIKKKLKKTSKRSKRCEGWRSDCANHSENCELHSSCCAKHYRAARKLKHGEKCSVWPLPTSILRSQNHQQCDGKSDDVSQLIPCSQDDNELCSCLAQSPSFACDVNSSPEPSPTNTSSPVVIHPDGFVSFTTTDELPLCRMSKGSSSLNGSTSRDYSALYESTSRDGSFLNRTATLDESIPNDMTTTDMSDFNSMTSRDLSVLNGKDASAFDGMTSRDPSSHNGMMSRDASAISNITSRSTLDGMTSRDASALYETSGEASALYGTTGCDPTPRVGNLTQELYKLAKYGWYWGPINRSEAEEKLIDQPDGAFLVRDSSDDRYILSLSFRSYGKTLHTRIEHSNGLFSFYSQPEPEGHNSIVELIQQSMCFSQSGVFCYSRSRSPGSPSFPVRLTKPVSRFTQVRSLQYLCRFVIRQFTRYDHIQKLPLPPRIKGYLEEGHY